MRIIGHRGAAAVAPENTAQGIARAFADGADAVEVDVRATADGRLVLLHDETLQRTAPGAPGAGEPVWTLPFERIATAVCSLEDAWDAAAGRMILEVKGAWGSGRASEVAALVALFLAPRPADAVVVSSFDLPALRAFREAGGTAPTGVLTAAAIDGASNVQAAVAEGHAWCFVPDQAADALVIAQAKADGKTVVAWTVNDPARIVALDGAGIHGIITDDPAAAATALADQA